MVANCTNAVQLVHQRTNLPAGACLLHLEPCENGDYLACVHSFTEHLLNTRFMQGPIPVMEMQQRARWPNAYI